MSHPSCVYSPKFGGSEKQTGDQKVGVSDLDGRTFTKAHAILGSEKNDKELVTSRYVILFHIYINFVV